MFTSDVTLRSIQPVDFGRNRMCGRCTRSVAGNSFLWETVSVSNTRINWDEGQSEMSKVHVNLTYTEASTFVVFEIRKSANHVTLTLHRHLVFGVCLFCFEDHSSFTLKTKE